MQISFWLLILASVFEVLLFIGLIIFFIRLRRSEALLNILQANQEQLLARLHLNAELEQELMHSFAQRQAELQDLDRKLEERVASLKSLLMEADGVNRSPQLLREIIVAGNRSGKSLQDLARSTNLSIDEIRLILSKNN
jgi:uncharacterized protein HemX